MPEVKLDRKAQILILKDIAAICDDIADDVTNIDGWEESGALLGIKTIAEAQIPRIENLIANLKSE